MCNFGVVIVYREMVILTKQCVSWVSVNAKYWFRYYCMGMEWFNSFEKILQHNALRITTGWRNNAYVMTQVLWSSTIYDQDKTVQTILPLAYWVYPIPGMLKANVFFEVNTLLNSFHKAPPPFFFTKIAGKTNIIMQFRLRIRHFCHIHQNTMLFNTPITM